MRVFNSVGEAVCIKNVGILEPIELPEEVKREDLRKWLGEEVEINGIVHKVYGVESQCTMYLPKGTKVGVLVQSWRNG